MTGTADQVAHLGCIQQMQRRRMVSRLLLLGVATATVLAIVREIGLPQTSGEAMFWGMIMTIYAISQVGTLIMAGQMLCKGQR